MGETTGATRTVAEERASSERRPRGPFDPDELLETVRAAFAQTGPPPT